MRHQPRPLLRLALLAALAFVPARVVVAAEAGFAVVVNAANPVTSLAKEDVSKLFLKKTTAWPSGASVTPVDLDESAPARERFTQAVHGKPLSAIRSYWQQRIFSGQDIPPRSLKTDAAVLAFVRENPGAIGYVAAESAEAPGVKVLNLR